LVDKINTGLQDPTDPGFGGHGLAAKGQCVFVSNYKGASLSAVVYGNCVDGEIESSTVVKIAPSPHTIYLPLSGKNASASGPVVATIPLSGRPKGMAVAGNFLFVTLPVDGSEQPWNKVAVVDLTRRVVHKISTHGEHPHTVALARGNVERNSRKRDGSKARHAPCWSVERDTPRAGMWSEARLLPESV
jgi:hypothetical protein